MKCKSCFNEILDTESYLQANLIPEECPEGYRKFGCSPYVIYCNKCANEMMRYIFEKNNQKI